MAADIQPQSASQLPSNLEVATKGIGAAAIVLYVVGYLVISIHHSTYGVTQIDPFKSRIISAGGWFAVMTFIPAFTCLEAMKWKRASWDQVLRFVFPYWMVCCTVTLSAVIIFTSSSSLMSPNWAEISGLFGVSVALAYPGLKKPKQFWVGALSGLATVFFVMWSIKNINKAGTFTFSSVILWFFAVGFFTVLELMNRTDPQLKDPRWIRTFFGLLLLIFIFAGVYFPHIRASWGGGGPVSIRVHTTKESTFRPNEDIDGLLIDEEAAGLYLMPNQSTRAIFLPRATIALISFSEPDPKSEIR
ncbi:MAG: hypothetical protein JWM43_1815 [Acidobacteriaceae bacterium]|nr:hypothetical protein [Acidobacteriaceae bacterium]